MTDANSGHVLSGQGTHERISPVTHEASGDPALQQAHREAKETVGNRLAFVSAAIWIGGVTGLYLLVFLPQQMAMAQATLFALGLLLPAAAPWLAYRRLIAAEVDQRRKNLAEQRAAACPRPDEGAA